MSMNMKKISIKSALEQVKDWCDDDLQDYVNLDCGWRGLKLIDLANQEHLPLYVDNDGDLYVKTKDGYLGIGD